MLLFESLCQFFSFYRQVMHILLLCVYVCKREREKERDGPNDRERKREKESEKEREIESRKHILREKERLSYIDELNGRDRERRERVKVYFYYR